MKTVKPFFWAESTNYVNDGSGKPWRTGAIPTKAVPPVSFQTDGTVPGDRYAAQWENYVKNLTGLAIQDLQVDQLSSWNKMATSSDDSTQNSTGWIWNPVAKLWVQMSGTTLNYRDIIGNVVRTATLGASAGVLDLSASLAGFGVAVSNGGAATATRKILHTLQGSASGSITMAQPTITTPTSGTTLVFAGGNAVAIPASQGLYFLGTSNGTWSVLTNVIGSGSWTATALPGTPGGGITSALTYSKGGFFFTDPLSGDWYIIGSDSSNTSIYKWSAGVPGTWTQVYNGASLLGGGTLFSAPAYDETTQEWVYVVDASVTRATDATATRFRTRTYRAPRLTPATGVTLAKTVSKLAIANATDLGNGVIVGNAMRFTGQSSTPLTTVVYDIAVSTNYGNTWRLVGYDYEMAEASDTFPGSYMANAKFLVSEDSLIMAFRNTSQRLCYSGLVRPGSDMATYIGT